MVDGPGSYIRGISTGTKNRRYPPDSVRSASESGGAQQLMATVPKTLACDFPVAGVSGRRYPAVPAMLIMLVDVFTLSLTILFCVLIRKLLGGVYQIPTYSDLWPVLGLF